MAKALFLSRACLDSSSSVGGVQMPVLYEAGENSKKDIQEMLTHSNTINIQEVILENT